MGRMFNQWKKKKKKKKRRMRNSSVKEACQQSSD
jgi:16S rRNA U1498 N3-methylase RsmE